MCEKPITPEEAKVRAEKLPYPESIFPLLEEAASMGDSESYCAYAAVVERTECPEDRVDEVTQKLLDTQQILLGAVAAEAAKYSDMVCQDMAGETADAEAAINEAVELAIDSLTGGPPDEGEGKETEPSEGTGETTAEEPTSEGSTPKETTSESTTPADTSSSEPEAPRHLADAAGGGDT